MPLTDFVLYQYFKYRQSKIDAVINSQAHFQFKLLNIILRENSTSEYGRQYSFSKIKNYETYKSSVPVVTYEAIFPLIKKMMEGESRILTNQKINWFAKSSGTSSGRSKYIPVSRHYLTEGHLKCAWDAASFIYRDDPSAKLFADRSLIMGGSLEQLSKGKMAGDISAIILHHFPKVGRRFYTPDFDTALLSDWEEKITRTAEITSKQAVTLLAGVPTWTMVLLKRILEITGKDSISEVWPNLRSYLHGGVGFEPYREIFREIIPSNKVTFREVYNASEGYFAMQDQADIDGMLLMSDHQIFYEFVHVDQLADKSYSALTIDGVKLGDEYALIITNSSGLYRYLIGDIVQIVTVNPVRVKVVSRISEYLNVFGEEVSVYNVNKALSIVCEKHEVVINDFTVAPVFLAMNNKGGHEWLIEFIKCPVSKDRFEKDLDITLRKLNSDYDAKRYGDLALVNLKVSFMENGHFERWQKSKGKYGGQNKVPRLQNNRDLLEEIKSFK